MKILFKCDRLDIDLSGTQNFAEDTFSYEYDDFLIWSYGFYLNIQELLEKFQCKDIRDILLTLIQLHETVSLFINGTYAIVIYNKKTNDICIYNDLLSKLSIYYYYDNGSKTFAASDSFFKTLQIVRNNKFPYTIDSLGIKMMLSHGIFYDDLTYVREIKFLKPFEYLIIKNGILEIKTIERPKMISPSLDEAAEQIHKRFIKAVEFQYKKNENAGFPQIITLSGGMDSRSTFLYSLASGYKQQICYNYAESTSLDFEISKELALKNNCSYFYHAIDHGNHLFDRDEICKSNDAQATYSGPSGTFECLKFFRTERMGIVHTGLGGGEIMGDMRVPDKPTTTEKILDSLKYRMGKGKKESTWESFFNSLNCTEEEIKRMKEVKGKYTDFKEFQSLNDMRRCLNSQKIAQSFGVDYVSPFLYEEFFCYMLSIPYRLTKNRKLYLYWQKKYNKKQFETPSTFQMGCRPGNKLGYYIKRLCKYGINKMGRKTKYDMNPEEFWISTNPQILDTQKKLYLSDLNAIKGKIDSKLCTYIEKSWSSETAPRANVLTATFALKKIVE